jgi:hypothetical protein
MFLWKLTSAAPSPEAGEGADDAVEEDEVDPLAKPIVIDAASSSASGANERQRRTYYMEWFDMNQLWQDISDDPRFAGEGVQNAIVTFVSLVILSGTDFFAGPSRNFLPDIGAEKVVWPTFAQNTKQFSHLVQLSHALEPDPRAMRDIVVDQDAFVEFAHQCYLFKHGKVAAKLAQDPDVPDGSAMSYVKKMLTQRESTRVKKIKAQLAKVKDEEERAKLEARLAPRPANTVVEEDRLRVLAQHLAWNINYWIKGYRGDFRQPDPFERHPETGLSIWGFEQDEVNGPRIAFGVAAPSLEELDENYARHFMSRKRARMAAPGINE